MSKIIEKFAKMAIGVNHGASTSSDDNNSINSDEKKKRTRRKPHSKAKQDDKKLAVNVQNDFSVKFKWGGFFQGVMFRKNNQNTKKRKRIRVGSFKLNVDLPALFVTQKFFSGQIRERNNINFQEYLARFKNRSKKSTELTQKKPAKSRKSKRTERSRLRAEKRALKQVFAPYLTEEEVKLGLESGLLLSGYIRINPKNFKNAYISNEDTSLADYLISSLVDRNRALEGDKVVFRVKPESEWTEGKKSVSVVYIQELIHPRITVGTLKCSNDIILFYPRDKRVPILTIPKIHCPITNFDNFNPDQLFVAQLIDWQSPNCALGIILESLGLSGDLQVESQGILREFCLDTTPFPADIVPNIEINEKEYSKRLDLRKECIFTIDPATARDLDDAVSIKPIAGGKYQVGVHISDAAHFLRAGTELDQLVSKKATTIYLIDKVYHMLPIELCLNCSLLPGKDKLAFSVLWEMDEEGQIDNVKFTKSVINSCSQLSYEHAQQFIENPNNLDNLPEIHGGFTGKDLSDKVNSLQRIAVNLRRKRLENGALRIDQPKLSFKLSPTGEPEEFWVQERKDAHQMIEEFMLLANISVAIRIKEAFPEIAFLRCHEPPKNTMLNELERMLESCGVFIDISSSGSIQQSLQKYITDDFSGICRGVVLNHLLAKSMTRARYFCASTQKEDDFRHYALSVPIYTHFTSPIRRYADIMVHRLLSAALGYEDRPQWDEDYVSAIAANCNAMKYNAKRAGEASSDLFLAHYIENHPPCIEGAVVVDVRDMSFDVVVLKTGTVLRIYMDNLENTVVWSREIVTDHSDDKNNEQKKLYRITISFSKENNLPEVTLIIQLFTFVKVELKRKDKTYNLEAKLLRPVTVD